VKKGGLRATQILMIHEHHKYPPGKRIFWIFTLYADKVETLVNEKGAL